jgi:hypothetical protein
MEIAMAYREKSAWVMGAVMALAGLYYLNLVVSGSRSAGGIAPPTGTLIAYVLAVVIASIVAQVTLAVSSPKEANAPADERERPALDRAGNLAGIILSSGIVISLLYFLYRGDGYLLFHMIMGSLIVAQIGDYALQILLLRWTA